MALLSRDPVTLVTICFHGQMNLGRYVVCARSNRLYSALSAVDYEEASYRGRIFLAPGVVIPTAPFAWQINTAKRKARCKELLAK